LFLQKINPNNYEEKELLVKVQGIAIIADAGDNNIGTEY